MQKSDFPLVYIVMRNHNAYDLTSVALKSLYALTYRNFKIIVVNDGTTDGSGKLLKEKFPKLILIESEKYIEYCTGLNLGTKYALENGGEYVFLINNDTKEFSSNYLEKVVEAFEENSKVGLVGSIVYNFDGKKLWTGNPKNKLDVPMETPTEGYIIKKEVFENIGMLDEKLVRYFEDLDFIIRLRKAGYETKSVPGISFHHLGNGTSSKQAYIPNFYRPRNLIWFIKHYNKDKSFFWKLKRYVTYSKANMVRISKFISKKQYIKALIGLFAFSYGTIIGLITKWK